MVRGKGEEMRAQDMTYEKGFSDGYKLAHEELQESYKKLGELYSTVQTRYIVVTQEKYDEIIKKSKEVSK